MLTYVYIYTSPWCNVQRGTHVHRNQDEKLIRPKRLNTQRASSTRHLPGLAGASLIFQWRGMVEYIPCYSAPELHWDLLPATRLASMKILIEQNIKKRTGPALCVLSGSDHKMAKVPCVLNGTVIGL